MKHGSQNSSEDRLESVHWLLSLAATLFHELLLLLLRLHPCSIRVSSVAQRIFISHLASFFTPNNGIAGFILLWLRGLRLIAIGFDSQLFASFVPDGPAPSVYLAEIPPARRHHTKGRLSGLTRDAIHLETLGASFPG